MFFMFAVMCLCITANAQFYTSTIYYYVKAGDELKENSTVYVFSFDGKKMKYAAPSLNNAKRLLKSNSSYYSEYFLNNGTGASFNSEYTTSNKTTYVVSRVVGGHMEMGTVSMGDMMAGNYSNYWNGARQVGGHTEYEYYTFSNDKTTMIKWTSPNSKVYYKQISVSDLQKRTSEYDFLE